MPGATNPDSGRFRTAGGGGPRVWREGASFSLQPGDKVGLVGRNGTGKTTLMRTLVGYRSPAAGSILRSGNLGYFSQEAVLPDLDHPDATALGRGGAAARARPHPCPFRGGFRTARRLPRRGRGQANGRRPGARQRRVVTT